MLTLHDLSVALRRPRGYRKRNQCKRCKSTGYVKSAKYKMSQICKDCRGTGRKINKD